MESYLSLLNAESRVARAKAMKELLSFLNERQKDDPAEGPELDETEKIMMKIRNGLDSDDDENADDDDALEENLKIVPNLLASLRSDTSDRCRELAFDCLYKLIEVSRFGDRKMSRVVVDLLHAMAKRIDIEGEGECCEELRLAVVKAVPSLVDRLTPDLYPSIADAVMIIIKSGLCDQWPQILKISARIITPVIQELSSVVYSKLDELSIPLCKAITHNHSKVRTEVIQAIGNVLVTGGSHAKTPKDYFRHLTQRTFDRSDKVRLVLAQSSGLILCHYSDRYSHFHRILPIILALLGDENDEVKNTAWDEWEAAGDIFLDENLEEYRSHVDFPKPPPPNFKEGERRPSLGCRLLVQKEASKIIPGALQDLSDWSEETRVTCANLLYMITLHCEDDNGAFQAPALLAALLRAGDDPEPLVVQPVLECARLVGVFVPLTVSWPILYSSLNSSAPLDAVLAVTACVFEGNSELKELTKVEESSELADIFDEITDVITSPVILHTRIVTQLAYILRIVRAVVCPTENVMHSQRLFTAALSVMAFAPNENTLKTQALNVISQIYNNGVPHKIIFGNHIGPILEELTLMPSNAWTEVTPEKALFETLVKIGATYDALEGHHDVILEILTTHAGDSVEDPEVRLSMITLTRTMVSYAPEPILVKLLKEIVCPALVWRAGKSESAVRTAALSLLRDIGYHLADEKLDLSLEPAIVDGLLEGCIFQIDNSSSVQCRVISCQCLGFLLRYLTPEKVLDFYSHLLRRLDDENYEVREVAVRSLIRFFNDQIQHLPESHVEHIADILMLHLDEEDSDSPTHIQMVIFESVKVLGKYCPALVVSVAKKWKPKLRFSKLCDSLIESLQ